MFFFVFFRHFKCGCSVESTLPHLAPRKYNLYRKSRSSFVCIYYMICHVYDNIYINISYLNVKNLNIDTDNKIVTRSSGKVQFLLDLTSIMREQTAL